MRNDIAAWPPSACRGLVARALQELGGIDVLVSNAAYQRTREAIEDIPDEEWDHTLATNLSAMFHPVTAAVPHMKPGAAIIGSSSVNSDMPNATLLPYAVTKAAIANRPRTWRASATTSRSPGPGSRPSSSRSPCSWRAMTRATSPAPASR
jgi:NAD(P)-dependent dehydrogenase (short-subunit alcohol dehydrogenase family)